MSALTFTEMITVVVSIVAITAVSVVIGHLLERPAKALLSYLMRPIDKTWHYATGSAQFTFFDADFRYRVNYKGKKIAWQVKKEEIFQIFSSDNDAREMSKFIKKFSKGLVDTRVTFGPGKQEHNYDNYQNMTLITLVGWAPLKRSRWEWAQYATDKSTQHVEESLSYQNV